MEIEMVSINTKAFYYSLRQAIKPLFNNIFVCSKEKLKTKSACIVH